MRSTGFIVAVLALLAISAFGLGLWMLGEDTASALERERAAASEASGPSEDEHTGRAARGAENGGVAAGGERREASEAPGWVIAGTTRVAERAVGGIRLRVERHEGYAWGDAPRTREVESDEEGRFRCAFDPPAGTTRVRIVSASEDVRVSSVDVLVVRGKAPPDDLVLRCYPLDCSCELEVVDENERPIRGAWVVRGNKKELGVTDARGRLRVRATAASGKLNLQVGAPGFGVRKHVVAGLEVDKLTESRVTLVRATTIRGVVVDARGTPIAGARVQNFMSIFFRHATSDGNGRFVIDWAAPGRSTYMVFARKEGYLEARADVASADLGEELRLVLERGVRVSGRVTDEAGAPIPAAELYIGFSPSAYGRLDARADDDGRFDFPVVAPGEQRLSCEAEGYAPKVQQIQVPKGEVGILLDVELDRGSFVAGRLVDADGAGLEGLSIAVLTHPEGGSRGEYLDRGDRSDADGRFRVETLPEGLVQVEVYARGFRRHLEKGVATGTDELEIRMTRSAQLAGRVLDAETGAPIPEFRIRFANSAAGMSATWVRQGVAFSSPAGEWVSKSEALQEGKRYNLQVWAEGYAFGSFAGAVAKAAASADDCVVRLRRGAEVSGTVLEKASGRAIPEARVTVSLADARYSPRSYGEPYGRIQAVTDENGAFVLRDVPAGEVELVVENGDFVVLRDGPFGVREGEKLRRSLALVRAARIEGRLLDASGAPLAGSVSAHELRPARGEGKRWHGQARKDGEFRIRQVPAGEYVLQAFPLLPDGSSGVVRGKARVEPGATARVELRLASDAICEVEVRVANAEPGYVYVSRADERARAGFVRVAPEGGVARVRLRGLTPGRWCVSGMRQVRGKVPELVFEWPRTDVAPLVLDMR